MTHLLDLYAHPALVLSLFQNLQKFGVSEPLLMPVLLYAYVTYPTISGRNCRSPERRRILNSPGSQAYFLLEMYPVTFWTGLGWWSSKTSDQKSPGAHQ